MKITNFLLAAVNSKYIHTNLAVRYLKKYAEKYINSIEFMEFSINDSIHSILKELFLYNADVYGFSCYIWNIELVLKLCSSIKAAKPEAIIILGGPEVSFDPAAIMSANLSVDFIISGEGELTFLELAKQLEAGDGAFDSIKGLTYRDGASIKQNPARELLEDMDELPFPYDGFEDLENKIIYYETSRGCPYNCQYCLSSTIEGVRNFSMDRVKAEIAYFVKSGIKQVKLVDRTFNCNKQRTLELVNYIISLDASTNFHFEVAADIMDEELLQAFAKAPKGLFQFEIGVQTTNTDALEAIRRPMDINRVKSNVSRLKAMDNAHLHLDLIAGLPYEDYESFRYSFNDVYALRPHMLQLGFLKLLKGSRLRADSEVYEIKYHSFPPYEVICTKWLSYSDILKLKDIEHLLELYNNSGRFLNCLEYVLEVFYKDTFSFYEDFSQYWNCKGFYASPKSLGDLFSILYDFIATNKGFALQFNELIKLDWLLCGKGGPLPAGIIRNEHSTVKEKAQELIKDAHFIKNLLPDLEDSVVKAVQKSAYYELFSVDVLGNPYTERQSLVFFLPMVGADGKEIITHSLCPDNL